MKEQIPNQEKEWYKFRIKSFEKGDLKIEINVFGESELIHEFEDVYQDAYEVEYIKVTDKNQKFFIIDKSFLPSDYRFLFNKSKLLECDHFDKYITFSDLSKKGAFSTLFHEIGHTLKDKDKTKRRYSPSGIERLNPEEQKEELKRIVEDERNAWAFAIQKIRSFRARGFDLESEIEDLREYYIECLKGYDIEYRRTTHGKPVFIKGDKDWEKELKEYYEDEDKASEYYMRKEREYYQ